MKDQNEQNIFSCLIKLYHDSSKWEKEGINAEEFSHRVRSRVQSVIQLLLTTPLESSMRFQIEIPEEENMFDRLAIRHMEVI
jgi:hypothetical protein